MQSGGEATENHEGRGDGGAGGGEDAPPATPMSPSEDGDAEQGGEEEAATPAVKGPSPSTLCEECETSDIIWDCDVCAMGFCDMCFDVLHRKGKRAKHGKRSRNGGTAPAVAQAGGIGTLSTASCSIIGGGGGESNASKTGTSPPKVRKPSSSSFPSLSSFFTGGTPAPAPAPHPSQTVPLGSSQPVLERAKYIPLRLSYEQRKMLRLVEATLTACDYTARVDQIFKTPAHREQAQLRQITAVLEGLLLSSNYKLGQELAEERDYEKYEGFFQLCFEIARRHKIMNPEKMRGEYGKLAYLLQDAVSTKIRRHLQCNVASGIKTVYRLLEERGGLPLLEDQYIYVATQEILPDVSKTRAQIQAEIKKKERAIEHLATKYASNHLTEDEIRQCLYSICDNNSFLNSNRVPIDKTIRLLSEYFSPDSVEPGYSLSIAQGQDGARLTHSHERQYNFALQSMTLWREITDDMFRLWCLAEEDLLSSDAAYELKDTGQGHHRVQQCPKTFYAMQDILHKTQRRVGNWVGSSVIHLGDHNVPNALMFIDKYTQVPRILAPIVQCLEQIERIYADDEGVKNLINQTFGGIEKLKKDILYDFFKNAFDGSGGDNFFDAGSCIDGRLTSAWNWCSQLTHKPFCPIFRLTGFLSFDGDFDR